MGQYHTIFAPTRNACLPARPLGGFVKAIEQAWNPTMGAALGSLCATGFAKTNPYTPYLDGTWAGEPILLIGDYAEKDDLRGHPALADTNEAVLYEAYHDAKDMKTSTKPRKNMASVSSHLQAGLENILRTRFVESNFGLPSEIGPLIKNTQGQYAPDPKFHSNMQEAVEYYGRVCPDSSVWQRDPLGVKKAAPIPDNVATLPQAQDAGLWISIDAQEYIDPATMGACTVDDTFNSQPINFALITLIAHHAIRGGGDINDQDIGAIGRWRGHRLAFVGAQGITIDGEVVTPDTIRTTWNNITSLAQAVDPENNYSEFAEKRTFLPVSAAGAQEKAVLEAIVDLLTNDIQEESWHIRAAPPIAHGTMDIPAMSVVYSGTGDQVFWISPETRRAVAQLANKLDAAYDVHS